VVLKDGPLCSLIAEWGPMRANSLRTTSTTNESISDSACLLEFGCMDGRVSSAEEDGNDQHRNRDPIPCKRLVSAGAHETN
jgi:hypothetical protein